MDDNRVRFGWVGPTLIGLILGAALAATVRADDSPPVVPAGWPVPAQVGRARPEGVAAEAEAKGKAGEEDGPLDPFFDLIDPARLQRELDEALGDRFERRRRRRPQQPARPEVPELGEPVFFDLTRPLGARKYSNELNYLLNPSTANAPTLQVIEYEYAFADWNAVELDLAYFNQTLEIVTPFYQRTLGVGRGGRSVRGFQVSPDIYLRSGFVGGSAVYLYGWKPSTESRFSTLTFVGANRQLIGGFQFPTSSPARFGPMLPAVATSRTSPDDRVYGAWRPTLNFDLFYKLTETISLGMENDLFFQSGHASEYFSFPFVTWEAGQHAFFQAGGGYYHFEGRDQFTFLLHLNFVNPSVKVTDEDEKPEVAETDTPEAATSTARPGPIRRWIERRLSSSPDPNGPI